MRVLVFRPGQLGDTLVAIPALQAVRAHFRDARIIFLSDRQQGRSWAVGKDVLDGTGLVDRFESYTAFRQEGSQDLEISRAGSGMAQCVERKI
jgi:hypothetical protein